jgi:hypothetical protein
MIVVVLDDDVDECSGAIVLLGQRRKATFLFDTLGTKASMDAEVATIAKQAVVLIVNLMFSLIQ